jgi:hypothetical protein
MFGDIHIAKCFPKLLFFISMFHEMEEIHIQPYGRYKFNLQAFKVSKVSDIYNEFDLIVHRMVRFQLTSINLGLYEHYLPTGKRF